MTLRQFVMILRERWRLIAVVSAAVAVAGTAFALAQPKQFTSIATLYVAARTDESAGAAYQGSLLSEQRVKSYTDLINTDRVRDTVIAELGLAESRSELANSVEATSELDSVLISVGSTSESPEKASQIANSTARVAVQLINGLEAPPPGQLAPVELKLVEEATPPDQPSSAPTWLLLLAVVAVSAALGVSAGLAKNLFDQTLKSGEELRALVGRPTLSEVPIASDVDAGPADQTFLESFRRLRANLQFVQMESSCSALVITSSVPGEGKTTATMRLGDALAAAGFSVVLVDADMRRGTLTLRLGFEHAVGLSTLIVGRASVDQVVQRSRSVQYDAISSGSLPPNPSELLSSARMLAAIRELRERYDYILFDTPPILPATDATVLARICDGVVLVCRAQVTTKGDTAESVGRLRDVSAAILGSVLNGVARPRGAAYEAYDVPRDRARGDSWTAGANRADQTDTTNTRELVNRNAPPVKPAPHRRS